MQVLERGLKNKAGNIIKNKKNRVSRILACPQAPTFGEVPARSERKCRRDRQCGDGERCCDWSDTKHCLKGIVKKPRLG